ncbi:putative short chain dehydrogenase [Cellulomonas flavigena DSM 20109]|uniref:Putative short chain dehydrogenase n=1 Tax=Cellulomonas flavigena (strain ATCC 482 / DSM 20109 / BCRC 11376 / JCM 18109 / NBRC 3775 / NCIMB 8073 / NRS 134) TaxID=446466 RepID=D5UGY6_CELFN|nr:SDR family NAD(P)-dependent oxidoreductase [Cellulomonas flavigena]ADG73189.1 putative short chain dehydrogenase [Cellulomonas flavigena DSM 20109]
MSAHTPTPELEPTDVDTPDVPGVDAGEFATFLRVADQVAALPQDHPQHAAARRAASSMFKAAKKHRRTEKRRMIAEADAAVVAATATGSPGRIDDETNGIPLSSAATGATAGTLLKPRPCYVCKQDYTVVDAFYHQLCPQCAALHHAKRDARTDLTGRRALLTGGRAKIGMYIALRLLRDGADLTITTRFPKDAVRRFGAMEDSADWMDRLHVVGIDLRDPSQVVSLADHVAAQGPLDILVNNAAQTVRRSPGAYSRIAEAELAPLHDEGAAMITTFGVTSDAHPRALAGSVSELTSPALAIERATRDAAELVQQSLTADAASLERLVAGTSIDAGGLIPDVAETNSWVATVEQVDPMELLEVQLCNQTAPFILISRLRPALAASPARRTYIVNVSAMEGVFSRGYKGPGHPHTNMSKAALNMLTRTSAAEMLDDGILMTAVDTGWITDERPHFTKVRLAEEGFHAPLDLVDGAARVYDPIVRGEAGEDLYGCFLKDYARSQW